VTIGRRGEARRYLVSGDDDAEPLAGLMSPKGRTRDELIKLITDETPLTADDIAYARPRPEGIAAFNRARAEWQSVARALDKALGGKRRRCVADGAQRLRRRRAAG
jgi:hypothetical protein